MSTPTLDLPPRLDLPALAALQGELIARRGTDLTLDAARVEHLGALALQLIRSAARSWAEDGHALSFENASTDLADQLALLGFDPASVTRWEAAP
ncbi:MAG: chemotaxis protein CheX [Rhodobacterales bacterium]|nr:MAG: chemotaxis protein CheX [Rhodobacterales bacterium]